MSMVGEKALLLHNIRSAHNVGSLFRTADAAGISRILLSGYTPRPIDVFGRENAEIAKTALGAHTWIPWEYRVSPSGFLKKAHADGWCIAGIEQDKRSVDYRTFHTNDSVLFVVGNEVLGMSKSLRDACDVLLEIPMYGKKESLNVAVATGIVLFGTLTQ